MAVWSSEVLAVCILQVKGYAQLGYGRQELWGLAACILQVKGYAQLGHGRLEFWGSGRLYTPGNGWHGFLVPTCQVSFMTIRSFLLPTYSRCIVTPSRGLVTITVSKACSRYVTQSLSFTGDGVWCSDPFDRPRRQPPRPGSRPQHGHGGLGHGTLGLEVPLAQSSSWACRTGPMHAGTLAQLSAWAWRTFGMKASLAQSLAFNPQQRNVQWTRKGLPLYLS